MVPVFNHLILIGSILERSEVVLPSAAIALGAVLLPVDQQVSVLAVGFFFSMLWGVGTKNLKCWAIGVYLGVELFHLLQHRVALMVQEGCNPPADESLFERYLFCREQNVHGKFLSRTFC